MTYNLFLFIAYVKGLPGSASPYGYSRQPVLYIDLKLFPLLKYLFSTRSANKVVVVVVKYNKKPEQGCLENSDLENLDPRPEKLRPSGCLEISDPKNSDPLGVSKSQTRKITHIFTPRGITCTDHENYLPRKEKKQLAVLDTCKDHENYTQH